METIARGRSIGINLLTYVLIFSSTVTLILTVNQLFFEYKSDLELLKERSEQIQEVYLPSVAKLLWNYDRDGLSELLLGMSKIPYVKYIEIDVDQEKFLDIGDRSALSSDFFPQEYNILYYSQGQQSYLGKLKLYFSKEKVLQRLWERVLIILLSQGLKTFMVSFFIVYVVRRLITQHLQKMSQYAQQLTIDNLNQALVLDRPYPESGKKMDELDYVVLSINEMRKNLRSSYFILKEEMRNSQLREAELEQRVQRLESKSSNHDQAHKMVKQKKESIEGNSERHSLFLRLKLETDFAIFLKNLRINWEKMREVKIFLEKNNVDYRGRLMFQQDNQQQWFPVLVGADPIYNDGIDMETLLENIHVLYQTLKNLIEISEKLETVVERESVS